MAPSGAGKNRPAFKSAAKTVRRHPPWCKLSKLESKPRRTVMHASLAFVNAAGIADREELRLLNTLLSSSAGAESTQPAKDKSNKNKGDAKPDSFKNDPPDPKNPNEVRERHLKKIKR
jgi:hypothetical protein